jgi:hypothetical protein
VQIQRDLRAKGSIPGRHNLVVPSARVTAFLRAIKLRTGVLVGVCKDARPSRRTRVDALIAVER